MRGKVNSSIDNLISQGITPAHAGKSKPPFTAFSDITDHPRTCGEKRCCADNVWAGNGSPPHMRGKVSKPKMANIHSRITPAHAGKSFSDFFKLSQSAGSPPHMRGKVKSLYQKRDEERITPAHAGKSLRTS